MANGNDYNPWESVANLLYPSSATKTVPNTVPTSNSLAAIATLGGKAQLSETLLTSLTPPPAPNTIPNYYNLATLAALGSKAPVGGTLLTGFPTPPPYKALSVPVAPVAKPQWIYVERRFNQLINTIGILDEEKADGMKKLGRVIGSLNRCYSNQSSETANMMLLGSWAKQTRVRPFSDIDVLFVLPYAVYQRYEQRLGNKQSQLLQEVRGNLKVTYPRTNIRGDGQVVIVNVDGVTIEVVPAFLLTDGRYWICDTNNGGRYKLADPAAELKALETADSVCHGNARQLTRLLKKWQIENNVPIKAFQLERLVTEFLVQWPNNQCGRSFYDRMMRDFFSFMCSRFNGFVTMPGTNERVALGVGWYPAAKAAQTSASRACGFERLNIDAMAGKVWQEIFGTDVPVSVS